MTNVPQDRPITSTPQGDPSAPGGVTPPPRASDDAPRQPTPTRSPKIARTRTSGIWLAVVIALLVLVFLLVFILQNLDPATVHFLGFSGSLPLALAMLFAAIAGGLLVALVGAARILQLRHQNKRARKALR